MIPSARKAFPGVLVGILLAGPAFAGPAAPDATGPQSATLLGQQQSRAKPARLRQARNARPRTVEAQTPGRSPLMQSAVAYSDLAYDDPRALAARGETPATAAATATVSDGRHQTASDGWHQTGMASWYGGQRWQGHLTSSGDRYDETILTAAHATLPLGTHIRVTVDGTDRSVIVLINDRPGTRTRVIDLSRSAAAELGIIDRGIARVTLSEL